MNSVKPERRMIRSRSKVKARNLRVERLPRALRYAVLLALLLALWQACDSLSNQVVVPGPREVAVAFWDGWLSGRLANAMLSATEALVVGMILGTMLAALLAALAVQTRIGEDLLGLLTFALGSIPAIVLLPLLALPLGAGTDVLVLVTVCAVVLPVADNLRIGMQNVNPTLALVGQNLGLRNWRMLGDVLLPAALPRAISGLKSGWTLVWHTLIAAELVFGVAGEGPGFFSDGAGNFLPVPDLLAGLLTIALAGVLVEVTFGLVERRTLVRWGMRSDH